MSSVACRVGLRSCQAGKPDLLYVRLSSLTHAQVGFSNHNHQAAALHEIKELAEKWRQNNEDKNSDSFVLLLSFCPHDSADSSPPSGCVMSIQTDAEIRVVERSLFASRHRVEKRKDALAAC
jgi:hypothetical protein